MHLNSPASLNQLLFITYNVSERTTANASTTLSDKGIKRKIQFKALTSRPLPEQKTPLRLFPVPDRLFSLNTKATR